MHSSENWYLNRSDRRTIEAAEIRFLRQMTENTIWDSRRSRDIRELSGILILMKN